LTSIFLNFDLSIESYRHGVSTVIPKMTKVAWQMKKKEIQKDVPGITKRKFIYNLSRASYEKDWGAQYRRPGLGTKILAILIRLIPKVGPFKALSFRMPTPAAEKMFMNSFNTSLQAYSEMIKEDTVTGHLEVEDDNLDTGTVTGPGNYQLADATYAELVERLAKDHFAQISPELRRILLFYYHDLDAPYATKRNKKKWAALVEELDLLKEMPPSTGTTAEQDR
jgi:hypothetical protein